MVERREGGERYGGRGREGREIRGGGEEEGGRRDPLIELSMAMLIDTHIHRHHVDKYTSCVRRVLRKSYSDL